MSLTSGGIEEIGGQDFIMTEDFLDPSMTMDEGPRFPVPSPYDSELPSTSSSYQISPSWTTQSSPFGTLPVPQLTTVQPHMADFEAPTGGRAMQRLAALRNTSEWMGMQHKMDTPGMSLRTPSMSSIASGMTDTSAMSGFTEMSGVSMQTTFTDVEQSANIMEQMEQHSMPSTSGETLEERKVQYEVSASSPVHMFKKVAETAKTDKLTRRISIRFYAKKKEDVYEGVKTINATMLSILADMHRDCMEAILTALMEDLMIDTRDKDSIHALSSLYDVAEASHSHFIQFIRRFPILINRIFSFIDVRGNMTGCTVAIKLVHWIFVEKDLKRQYKQKEYIQRYFDYILHSPDLAHKRRYVALDGLRQILVKRVFFDLRGIERYLDFLNKDLDESSTATPSSDLMLLRVERHEEVLAVIVNTLRSILMSAKEREKYMVDRVVECNGIQILTSWLGHNSGRLFKFIAECLKYTVQSAAIDKKDLRESISRVLKVLDNDDISSVLRLLDFLRPLATNHRQKKSFVDARPCGSLLNLVRVWVKKLESGSILDADTYRGAMRVISASLEILGILIDGDESVHGTAVSELQRDPNALEMILRVASYDFIYIHSVLQQNIPVAERSAMRDNVFSTMPEENRISEMEGKANAIRLLVRLVNSNLVAASLRDKKDPLHGESIVVMLWRRLWEVYSIIHTYSNLERTKGFKPQTNDLLSFTHPVAFFATRLLSNLYNDPFHFGEAVHLICLPHEAHGLQLTLNPLRLLVPEHRTQWSSSFRYFAAYLVAHLDFFMNKFSMHSSSRFQFPLYSWLQEADGINYTNVFCNVVTDLKKSGMMQDDVYQRVTSSFNFAMGNISPVLTPPNVPIHR